MQRNITLDITRTVAIAAMVIFHFIYDLKLFGYVKWDIPDGSPWREFRWVIITLFFLCLGVSLVFAHSQQFNARKFITRVLQIALSALLISVGSYIFINEHWIFFGVLHFLAFASLVTIAFVRKPLLSLSLGLLCFALASFQYLTNRFPFRLFFENLPHYTNDYVAPIPWLGMVFFGISLGHSTILKNDPLKASFAKISTNSIKTCLIWPGQHSLSIYLLHQPILIGSLFLISLIV
uniref:heparan-alpha-glucosaminide N-acetyltransferase n=1 Tax=Ningiella ruwaisensis TaxID=2364274 RepID=UPI00109F06F4|nr:heparan-alpha-glucosaminide N-acetyltransferase [Ningiella ruwaisensis]